MESPFVLSVYHFWMGFKSFLKFGIIFTIFTLKSRWTWPCNVHHKTICLFKFKGLISSTSAGDHTWFRVPCWLPGWGNTEGRHFVLMEEGGGGGGKVKLIISINILDFSYFPGLGYIGKCGRWTRRATWKTPTRVSSTVLAAISSRQSL